MTETSPLMEALAATSADPDDDPARLALFRALATSELLLLLSEPATGENLSPKIFGIDEGNVALVFDNEDRLTQFTGTESDFIGLPGRVLAEMMVENDLAMGINLGQQAATILPPPALKWFVDFLDEGPQEHQAQLTVVRQLTGAPQQVMAAVVGQIATMPGLATRAVFAEAEYANGDRAPMVALEGVEEKNRGPMAQAIDEAVGLSGVENARVDVAFPEEDSGLWDILNKVGRALDLKDIAEKAKAASAAKSEEPPKGPGMDPNNPPKLV